MPVRRREKVKGAFDFVLSANLSAETSSNAPEALFPLPFRDFRCKTWKEKKGRKYRIWIMEAKRVFVRSVSYALSDVISLCVLFPSFIPNE